MIRKRHLLWDTIDCKRQCQRYFSAWDLARKSCLFYWEHDLLHGNHLSVPRLAL